jgi:hypothetical protein
MATLDPIGSLVRGRPGLLLLTVTNPTRAAGGATVAITAAFSLPAGVTLRVEEAGHGWTCSSDDTITCTRRDLSAGWTTKAHIQLTVAATAADGVPSVELSGPGIQPLTAVATQGVVNGAPPDAAGAIGPSVPPQ